MFWFHFWTARTLGQFLYFKMALKTGSLIFLVNESYESKFGISSFFIISENNLFNVSAASDSDVSVFSITIGLLFFLDTTDFFSLDTDREQKFYCFPKFIIFYNIFIVTSKFWYYYFEPFKREAHIYFFFIHKPCNFLLFSFVKRGSWTSKFSLFHLRTYLLWKVFDWL